jgi:hypothetical protein
MVSVASPFSHFEKTRIPSPAFTATLVLDNAVPETLLLL